MAVDPIHPFVEVTRRFSTRQTTAVVLVAELAFALALIGIGTLAESAGAGAAGWVALAVGVAAAMLGLAAFAYVLFIRPELLRSDEQVLVDSLLTFALEEDVDDEKLVAVQKLLAAPKRTKPIEGHDE